MITINNFTLERPDIKKQWDSEKNSHINPYVLSSYSRRNVYWKCEEGHSWKATVYQRVKKGEGCPECSHHPKAHYSKLVTINPILEEQWNQEKNKNIDIEAQVIINTKKKIWWECGNGHQWKDKAINRTIEKDSGCPVCQSLPVAKPEITKEWHTKKNKVAPTQIQISSDRKVWWKCKEGHEWKERVNSRAKNSSSTCPECQSLSYTHPHLLEEWNYKKNHLSPKELKASFKLKVEWKCKQGHEWTESISDRATKGSTCPTCKEH